MKTEILKRAMFAMPLSKEARSSGILSGFEDEMEAEEANEEMPPMARTPQNPEILMNNLRGDIRSVDARYMELAQMVGEEAAMETPPEVLAMLQPQLAAPQGGIGGLPQGMGMAPPGMGMLPQGMPPGGAPQPGMAMPQGGIPMPQGMESAPPFSQGAEAPATPDGMPPIKAAAGAFITPATRAAQFLGDKASQYGSAANAALGRMFMQPSMTQPFLENVRGPGGRFTAEQIARGGDLVYPTFTQGLTQGASRLAEQYPRIANMLPAGMLAAAAAGEAGRVSPASTQSALVNQIPIDTREEMEARRKLLEQPPAVSFDLPTGMMTERGKPPVPIPMGPVDTSDAQSRRMMQPQAALAEEAPADTDPLGAFIQAKLSDQAARDAARGPAKTPAAQKALSKQERVKAAMGEYLPMFQELLGEDKEAAKTNALLLLAEAGFKLAGTPAPTMAAAFGKAFEGVPRGMAAIAAQEREMGLKLKSAALQQAISDVESQDKYAQALQLEMLKGDLKILQEQAKRGGGVIKDGGGGLRITETKDGSFVGTGIDPEDPTVKSAVGSRYTLRDTSNPFVENRGPAPTTIETDKGERVKLLSALRALDGSLAELDGLKGVYASAYGPNAWFQDKVNNLLVPVLPNSVVKPNFDVADAATRVRTAMNAINKQVAAAKDSGRVAVQEQEWAREITQSVSDPVKFFQDKELAAKQFNSLEAVLRNARQQVLTQLGYEKNDYVMRTPNTGTQTDPFVIPMDPDAQKVMFSFLGGSIGKVQDPRALVYVKMPNGRVDAFNPTQLRSLIQQ